MLKNAKHPLILTILLWLLLVVSPVSAGEYSPESDGFSFYRLENGFELYILENNASPFSEVVFTVKAGFASGNETVGGKITAGISDFYSRLFFQAEAENRKTLESALTELNAPEINAECNADCTLYRYSVHSSYLNKSLSSIYNAVSAPYWTDKTVLETFKNLKEEYSSWNNSVTGFINTTIDEHLYGSNTYSAKKLSPELNKAGAEELRSVLKTFGDRYYVPDNCALFISTSESKEKVLADVKKIFGTWPRGRLPKQLNFSGAASGQNETAAINASTEKSRYVLVSDDFSKDFTQVIIQYIPENGARDIETLAVQKAACHILQDGSAFRKQVSENRFFSIDDDSWLDASFVQQGMNSRVVIQALMRNDRENPADKLSSLEDFISSASFFMEDDFTARKNRIAEEASDARIDAPTLLYAVARNWAYGGTAYFYDFPETIKNLSYAQVKDFFRTKPCSFILVNSEIYKNIAKKLSKDYIVISDKGKASVTASVPDRGAKEKIVPSRENRRNYSYDNFVANSQKSFSSFELKNHIPCTIKTSDSKGFCLAICIDGGEISHPAYQRGMETVAVNALMQNIRKRLRIMHDEDVPLIHGAVPEVSASTDLYGSCITVSTVTENAEAVFKAVSDSFVYDDISAYQADALIFDLRSSWLVKRTGTDFQLFAKAMQLFYAGKPESAFYATEKELLNSIDFEELKKAYTSLISADRLRFIVCTENGSEDLCRRLLQNDFGILISADKSSILAKSKVKPSKPVIVDKTVYVDFDRVFSTDIKAEDAGPRPLKLIPTTKFDDPVQYYFAAPSCSSKSYPLFCAMMLEFERKLNESWKSGVSVELIKGAYSFVKVSFAAVPQKTDVFPLFARAFNSLQDYHSENQLRQIKDNYLNKTMFPISSAKETALLIREGILLENRADSYLVQYKTLEEADWNAFNESFDFLRGNFPIFEIFSASRK